MKKFILLVVLCLGLGAALSAEAAMYLGCDLGFNNCFYDATPENVKLLTVNFNLSGYFGKRVGFMMSWSLGGPVYVTEDDVERDLGGLTLKIQVSSILGVGFHIPITPKFNIKLGLGSYFSIYTLKERSVLNYQQANLGIGIMTIASYLVAPNIYVAGQLSCGLGFLIDTDFLIRAGFGVGFLL